MEVVRTSQRELPDYWVHVQVNNENCGLYDPTEQIGGQFVDGRIDNNVAVKNLREQLNGAHHIAVRVKQFKPSLKPGT